MHFPLDDLRRAVRGRRALVIAVTTCVVAVCFHLAWGWRAALLLVAAATWSCLAIQRVAPFIRRWNVVAHPGGRNGHARATPLLGGAALFVPLAAVLCWWAFGRGSLAHLSMFAAVGTVMLVGAWDDVRPLSPRVKLLGEVLAGVWLALGGFTIDTVHLPPFDPVATGWWGGPLVVAAVVVCANAFNLIDGLDGLAAGVALLASVGVAFAGGPVLVAAVVVGTCLGFLRHNLPRASIFLGDSGSLLLGTTVAVLIVSLPPTNNLAVGLGLLAYPLGDVALTVFRRLVRGKPLFAPDRSHVHHKVLQHVGAPAVALVLLLGFAALLMACALLLPGWLALAAIGLAWLGMAIALVVAGRVRLRRMLQSRPAFRQLHLTHTYVEGLLAVARDERQVRHALVLMAQELDLTELDVDDWSWRRPSIELPPGGTRQTLTLRRGRAAYAFAPESDVATAAERAAVVTDLIRGASRRLVQVGRAAALLPPEPPQPQPTEVRTEG